MYCASDPLPGKARDGCRVDVKRPLDGIGPSMGKHYEDIVVGSNVSSEICKIWSLFIRRVSYFWTSPLACRTSGAIVERYFTALDTS